MRAQYGVMGSHKEHNGTAKAERSKQKKNVWK